MNYLVKIDNDTLRKSIITTLIKKDFSYVGKDSNILLINIEKQTIEKYNLAEENYIVIDIYKLFEILP